MRDDTLRLSANEGRPCLPVRDVASLLDPEMLRRYPDPAPLEAALAARMGLDPGRVLATAGGDDAIDRAIRSYGGGGATVLSTQPAFEEYEAAARRSRARYSPVPREPDGPLPLASLVEAIGAERPSLVIVASPDNPGGGSISREELEALSSAARDAGAVLLLDVEYSEFDEEGEAYAAALRMPGVVSTGTFSKAYGLAGLRVGWAAGPEGVISRLREAGPPFSLSSFSIAAALAALERGEEARRAFVDRVRTERRRLAEALAATGAKTWPSRANFVTAFVPDAAAMAGALSARGVAVRAWPGKGMIRITCPGDEREFARLIGALGSIGRIG